MFDVRRLVVLQEVVRSGSLSSAAVTLNYTTSAVSQQITALERDIGVTLLVRGPNGARPTAAGSRLLEHAEAILPAIAAAERDLARMSSARPGAIRVASFASAAATILPPAIARFRALCPDVDVELVAADPADGVGLLAAGDVDAAVITEVPGERPEFPRLHGVPVYDDEFYVVLPASHRLAGAAEVPFAALADEQWIVSTETGVCPDVRVFEQACRQAGFVPSVTFRAEGYSTVQGLVAAGLGVSLVPSLAAYGGAHPDVVLRRVLGRRPVRRIAIATAHEPAASTPLGTFVSLARAAGAQFCSQPVYSVAERPFSVA
ncbi:LysR family transcriptional regulator [Mycolicibacterium flavescens]|uniref:LysR family transcriptional regulator n=1 Tax=Mycolicibacterium flavescens TaxID=1776 RepID=A0A1E3RMX1_MYCFV|nr:LysR family transcriptional regulator [Mycolicibacterium flavescens]MCV7281282.1 LysR family transcriptional regulator [Mycolicibacterium flavescens]ODQ91204.1 LysR family transcriptional regulator [Mycolicibacterium flavescens]